MDQLVAFFIVSLLQKLNDKLECLQVARQSNFNTFIVCNAVNHWPEVLDVVESPFLV